MDYDRDEHLGARATRATSGPVLRERPDFQADSDAPARPLAAPHRRATGRPSAHPGQSAAHVPAPPARRRRITTARPLSDSDRALVERASLSLDAIKPAPAPARGATADVADAPTAVVAVPPRELLDALRTDIAAAATEARLPAIRPNSTPISVITGAKLPAVRPAPVIPQRLRPRGAAHGVGLWLVGIFLVIGLLSLAVPIGERIASRQFTPHGAQVLTLRPDVAPTGPWASGAGISGLDIGGGGGPGVSAPGSAGLPVKPAAAQPSGTQPVATQPKPAAVQPSAPPPSGILAAPVQPWPPSNPYMAVPGHPAFAVGSPNGYYLVAWGQCTWWAQNKRRDENLQQMGNARYWAGSAAARGYRVDSTPAANATAVFQPGVQGAGGAGHVAHVEAVYPGGWFLVSEMNFYWNGGGWGRVDYRYAHAGAGVSFIY